LRYPIESLAKVENHGDFKPEPLGSLQKSNRPMGASPPKPTGAVAIKDSIPAVHDLPTSFLSEPLTLL